MSFFFLLCVNIVVMIASIVGIVLNRHLIAQYTAEYRRMPRSWHLVQKLVVFGFYVTSVAATVLIVICAIGLVSSE